MEELIKLEDKSYPEKRQTYREYAQKDEISACVDCVTDEIHSCFHENMISSASMGILPHISKFPMEWHTIKKYLIDGYVSFEIIFKDDDPIGLKELDPITLIPEIKDGKKQWIQFADNASMKRVLFDSQIAYISYSSVGSKQSYVDSLIRSYQLMKLAEDSFVASKISNMPGVKSDAVLKDVQYFADKFSAATRIPESFKRFDSAFNIQFDTVDKRWEKFIKKHALNLYGVYAKMANIEKYSVELKKLYE